jgi:hypothetical protein
MNIMELKAKVDAAIANGIDPDTTVVLGGYSGDWGILDNVLDPSESTSEEGVIWFTLQAHEEADDRFSPAHWAEF